MLTSFALMEFRGVSSFCKCIIMELITGINDNTCEH